jgi:type IV pilus assembly protein PilA
MFCPKCGAGLQDGSQFCERCGAPTTAQPHFEGAHNGAPIEPGKTSGKALGSLITGVFGLPFFPFAIVAIVLGHMSRSEIQRSNGRLQGTGMALTGLILGYAGIAFIPMILIIAAIAIPNLLRARMAANEAAAVGTIRIINTAEISYRSSYPDIGYACALTTLGGEPASPSAEHAGLIDNALTSGTKHGYRFVLQNCVNSGQGSNTYQIVASPVIANQTGVRAFCSDEHAIIKVDPNGSGDDCLVNGEPLR